MLYLSYRTVAEGSMSLTGSTSPRQRRNDRQEQISSKKHANLDRHGGPGRDLRDGISSIPAIRITREQPRTDCGELRSQRRLQLAFL
jgi:hypothetical protein